MEDISIIFKRGSIRKYKQDQKIKNEDLKTILDAGFAAPSALNLRPYHFIVIDDRCTLDRLSLCSRGKKVLISAPACIAVVGDLKINPFMEFVLNDTSACIENMLLAIHGLGLGGCWLGQTRQDDDKIKAILKIPNNMFVSGFIALGYPDESKVQKDRFDRKKIHYNSW